jgi:hypothetical protein
MTEGQAGLNSDHHQQKQQQQRRGNLFECYFFSRRDRRFLLGLQEGKKNVLGTQRR